MNLFKNKHGSGFASITGLHGTGSYAAAYWKAGKALVDNPLYQEGGKPDFSTFPIIFLYRHALELMLKSILVAHCEKYSKDPASLFKRGHKLMNDYVTELKSVVTNTGTFTNGDPVVDISSAQWTQLETVLDQWKDTDPDGMAFRYSTDQKAQKSLTKPQTTIDMQNFSQIMEDMLEFLANLRTQLDALAYHNIVQKTVLSDQPDEN